jgi:NADH-quinone oxidoreductase subunit M
MHFSLLFTLLTPLLGAIVLVFFDRKETDGIKYSAFIFSCVGLAFALTAWNSFDAQSHALQFAVSVPWITSSDIAFRIGGDGLGMMMLMISAAMMPIIILSAFRTILHREKEFYILMMVLQFGMFGIVMSLDLVLFYVFFELILIPLYFLIGIWGGERRIQAATKFFIYTMVGSLAMLIGIIWLGMAAKGTLGYFSTDLLKLRAIAPTFDTTLQLWLFIAFGLAFAVKVPLFPFHTWLPETYTEAPLPITLTLAGMVFKLGMFGFIRYGIDLFGGAVAIASPYIGVLAVIGIVYGALLALAQTDMKKLVVYSVISHKGFIMLGLFSLTAEGMQGGMVQIVNNGIATVALFICVGILYDRRKTYEIGEFGGAATLMPVLAVMMGIASFASAALPGLNGFVGEFLSLTGAFRSGFLGSWGYAIIGATGAVLSAAYSLKLYNGIMFGARLNPKNDVLSDIRPMEFAQLMPLVLLMLWLGFFPGIVMKTTDSLSRALAGKIELRTFGQSSYRIETLQREKMLVPVASHK